MSITAERKQQLIKEYAISDNDVGSPDVQIAILTERIKNLTDHISIHKKDFHTKRGLLVLVSKRRKLLDYLKEKNNSRYQDLINRLGIRK